MAAQKKYRALIIGRKSLDDELSSILNGYGYFVDHSRNRIEGVRKFRAHKQSLVILDVEMIQGFPERLFRYFRLVRESSVVLVAADAGYQAKASRFLVWGAHDILSLPLNRDAVNFTLGRTSAYHRSLVRSTFLKNVFFFAAALLPLWALFLYQILS